METPNLKKTIEERDWEETCQILRDYPHLAKEQLSEGEVDVLWEDAPLATIQVLLEAWPEAYKMEDCYDRNLVEIKIHAKQWDFLDVIFLQFPLCHEMNFARTAAYNGASLDFVENHWKEAGSLLYAVHNKDWEKFEEILKDHPHLANDRLSKDEFDVLWNEAPVKTVQVLLKAWPAAHVAKDSYEKNMIDIKLNANQWEFLDFIFQDFPQVLETQHATKAAMNGASLDFVEKHWKETGTLLYSVHNKDWERFNEMLKDYPHLARDHLSQNEFGILWRDAPLDIIQVLLEAWPGAHKCKCLYEDRYDSDLVEVKLYEKKWNFLQSILHEFPNIVTAENVQCAFYEDAPLDLFESMLDQHPNAPLEEHDITFRPIWKNRLGYFCAVLEKCPAATDVKEDTTYLTPLLLMFQEKERMTADWIGPILQVNPNAAKEKDFDGKTPLHLAYQHGASFEVINMIKQACPEAENERDNLGRFPQDLANQSEKNVFSAANETLIFVYDVAANQSDRLNTEKKSYPDNSVVVCRGDMLMRDLPVAQTKEDKKTHQDYSEQVLSRHNIFETLLDEFSKMVGVDDKHVIQKTAVIQALAVQYLSRKDGTIIDFGFFDNPGYWYQQEVLKLVMRVYCETQAKLDNPRPSILKDAEVCMEHLNGRKNENTSPKPSDKHFKAYDALTRWLTEGLGKSLYSLQGPVLKPLQSLFNKLFIRRGQTSVSVIGDLVRATLLVDDVEALKKIVQRIKNMFPNITKFRHPDKFDELAYFLTYIHDDLKKLPGSDVLPYRFKANSSQKKKDKPLWYNLNFFLQIPEYHRVGFSEMFVACELQIGLTEEINKHRKVHDAYERDRILSNQPLLKNYDAMEKGEDEHRFSQLVNCTEDDNKLIGKVLFGKIASEVLIPCTTTEGNDDRNNILSFENGPFYLSRKEIKASSFAKPKKLCLNNRSLNWFALDGPKRDRASNVHAAVNVAGLYNVDETKRYFVDSFVFKNSHFQGFYGTVGLYAHVGPYLFQVACGNFSLKRNDIVVVTSGRNFSYLEQPCPIPPGTTALEVILYGEVKGAREFGYGEMKLSLKVFDIC